MAEKQNLDEFAKDLHTLVCRFTAYWREMAMKSPEEYPGSMTQEEWEEQFLAYAESELELEHHRSKAPKEDEEEE